MFKKGHIPYSKGKRRSKKDNSPRNPNWFQPGTSGKSRILKSVEIPDTSVASTSYTRQSLQTPHTGGMTDRVCRLRPKEAADQQKEETRIALPKWIWVDKDFFMNFFPNLINTSCNEHKTLSPSCPKFQVKYCDPENLGPCLHVKLKCITCGYIVNGMKLSKEIPTGS
ncbi:unnamed protein product [Mytilus edulis]|uniref:Uncharacterized protein n=1 Tax=Mytilus edulis TaxID=6550 RepID=A0A8S3QUJ9_MYTED|nr:unnamed protein product [Mytilus edulis]